MFFYFCFDAAPFWGALKVIIGDYFVDVFFTFILMREITENAVLFSRWNLQVIVASRSDWVTKYIVET